MSIGDKLLKSAAAGGLTPSENFKTVIYTGNGGTQTIEVGFKPDLCWIKNREGTTWHNVQDTTRGATHHVYSNANTAQETTSDGLTAFTSTGFTLSSGNGFNNDGVGFVAWCWKAKGGTTSSNGVGSITSTVQANTDTGFSIVKYTGTGADATVGHGLGATLDLLIVKGLETTNDWSVLHKDGGAGDFLQLNGNSAESGAGSIFGSTFTRPTDTVFTVGNTGETGTNTKDYIAYCFTSISGFSKFGSYTGNGSANGPIIETGFEVGWLMVKRSDSSANWRIVDNGRSTSNPRQKVLFPNLTNAEFDGSSDAVNFLSNGFEIINNDTSWNASGGTFIYMAFATDPDTEAPTLASSFNIELYTGTKPNSQNVKGFGFSPSLAWIKMRDGTEWNQLIDTVRGATQTIYSNATNAQYADTGGLTSFDSDGFTIGGSTGFNQSGKSLVAWTWKANDDEPTLFGGDAAAVYKFEDNYNDVTGTYNGSGTSGTSFISGGKFNKAAAFSGTSSNMDTGITARNWESWSFWFKPGSSNTGYRVIVCTNNSGDIGQNLEYNGSNSLYVADILGGATNTNASVTIDLRDGDWHHIVITKTATKVRVYVDKVEKLSIANATGSSLQSGNEWSFGKGNYGDANSDFNIDQARYYQGVLEQEDIDKLYNETAADNDDLTLGSPKETIISANANAGFSIVKYTGNAISGTKVPHGLSSKPDMVIAKGLSGSASSWWVQHSSLAADKVLELNGTAAEATYSSVFNNTAATSTVVTLGSGDTNRSGETQILYCFHDVTGYSKFGSYTGSGSAGNAQNVGFQPDFLMFRRYNNSDNWVMVDTRRGEDKYLLADTTGTEQSLDILDFTSTGWTFKGSSMNNSSDNYIYAAFKKNVASNTTLANSFKAVTYTGDGASSKSITGVGFQPDFVWLKNRAGTTYHNLTDSVRGVGNQLNSNDTAVQEYNATFLTSFDTDGFSIGSANGYNNSGVNFVAWCWKAGNTWQSNIDGTIPSIVNVNTANGFSIVKYTGNDVSGATVGHGLGAVPDFILIKNLSITKSWMAWHSSLSGELGYLDNNDAFASSRYSWAFNSTQPTSSLVTFNNNSNSNDSHTNATNDYIMYCWTEKSGFSKFGSYTGSGSDGNAVSLGFQPDFVMIKRTNSTGGWLMFDSARNTSNPRNNRLEADSSSAATTGSATKFLDFNSTDFEANGSDTEVNASGSTYIYMAFKAN